MTTSLQGTWALSYFVLGTLSYSFVMLALKYGQSWDPCMDVHTYVYVRSFEDGKLCWTVDSRSPQRRDTSSAQNREIVFTGCLREDRNASYDSSLDIPVQTSDSLWSQCFSKWLEHICLFESNLSLHLRFNGVKRVAYSHTRGTIQNTNYRSRQSRRWNVTPWTFDWCCTVNL